MPHDKNGHELKIGDRVHVECRVTRIDLTADYCNVTLETAEVMPPTLDRSMIVLNSKQVAKP